MNNIFSCKLVEEDYQYGQYLLYPSLNKDAGKILFKNRLDTIDCNTDINLQITEWDEEHFGFKVGKINNPFFSFAKGSPDYRYEVERLLDLSKDNEVRVLILRMNGDNLSLLHEFENAGFRYYETIIWPVSNLDNQNLNNYSVTLFNPLKDNINELINIARDNQFKRGHFYSDNNFDVSKVDELYVKWVKTAVDGTNPIAILKADENIVGYFIFSIDENLSSATGYKYGILQSLSLDSNVRGKGFGRKLFEGTLYLLKEMGCNYSVSSYSSKNHLSAKLHSLFGFSSVYEEVTLHRWL